MASTFDLNYQDIKENTPEVVILPWGATEAHNYHLPYSTDVTEAFMVADRATDLANLSGAKTVCLPPIPFGANAQQLDQYITISFSVETIYKILLDVVFSLTRQGIKKLVIFNFHGGNEFKPFIRDLMGKHDIFILLIDAFSMLPIDVKEIFDESGDHAGELETSLMLYLREKSVRLEHAGEGKRNKYKLSSLSEKGVWTPRPWSKVHPDTGSGNPALATVKKGEQYFNKLSEATAKILLEVSETDYKQLP